MTYLLVDNGFDSVTVYQDAFVQPIHNWIFGDSAFNQMASVRPPLAFRAQSGLDFRSKV